MMHRSHGCGVIFDFDGTLADTVEDVTHAINQSLHRFDKESVTVERIRSLIGSGLRDLFRRLEPAQDDSFYDDLVSAYRPAYREFMLRHSRLYPGIREMLLTLRAAGYALAVLSNKPHEYTVPMCRALLDKFGFAVFQGAQEESKRKPDPDIALATAATMGCRPEDVWFVGDSPVDVATASAAGMTSVGVTWGYGDQAALEEAGCVYLVSKPSEIESLIARR